MSIFYKSFRILLYTLCIARQNLSIGVNVVSEGSPSLILRVLRISLGITTRPKSSTLLTIPVAVPGVLLADGAAASLTVRLRYSVSSSVAKHLPRSPIAAHTAIALDSATGGGQSRGRGHSLTSLRLPPAALGSLPCCFHIFLLLFSTLKCAKNPCALLVSHFL